MFNRLNKARNTFRNFNLFKSMIFLNDKKAQTKVW